MWYYEEGDRVSGPVDMAQLSDLVRQGLIRPDTRVWHEGMSQWLAAHQTELASLFTETSPSGSSPSGVGWFVPVAVVGYMLLFVLPQCVGYEPLWRKVDKVSVSPDSSTIFRQLRSPSLPVEVVCLTHRSSGEGRIRIHNGRSQELRLRVSMRDPQTDRGGTWYVTLPPDGSEEVSGRFRSGQVLTLHNAEYAEWSATIPDLLDP